MSQNSTQSVNDKLGVTPADKIMTTIDKDTVVEGAVTTRNGSGLMVFGEVRDGVNSEGTVVIAEGGLVSGPISAKRIVVAGRIAATAHDDAIDPKGIHAEILEVMPTAHISAHLISYGELEAHRGAQIHGRLQAHKAFAAAAAEKAEPAQRAAPVQVSSDTSAAAHAATGSAQTSNVAALPIQLRPRLDDSTSDARSSAPGNTPTSLASGMPADLTLDLPESNADAVEVSFSLAAAGSK